MQVTPEPVVAGLRSRAGPRLVLLAYALGEGGYQLVATLPGCGRAPAPWGDLQVDVPALGT